MKISKMTGKMEGIPSLNTNPLSNKYCNKQSKTKTICSRCYSRRILNTYRHTCIPPYQINSELLSKGMLKKIPKYNIAFFRFHSHGELINKIHYKNFCRIAEHNPQTMFVLWTKRINLTRNSAKPNNLILIYSTPQINCENPILPKGFDKVFSVYTSHSNNINCHGKCIECLKCYTKNNIIFINEVEKGCPINAKS